MLASSTRGAQLFQLTAFVCTVAALVVYGLTVHTLLLILLGYFLYGCLGIVVMFHRNLTHHSYVTHPLIVKIFSVLGCFSGTGSPLAWVAIHINHHLNSDQVSDPHSPMHKGIKIFTLDYVDQVDANTKWRMRGLVTDRFQQFLHRYYFAINIAYSLLLYAIGGFYLVAFFHLAPALITGVMSNVVNYVGHKPTWWGGYRTYNLNDQSSNNWLWAIPSWGEAWHNNHHRYPRDYTFKKQWWEFDISGLIIKLIKHNK